MSQQQTPRTNACPGIPEQKTEQPKTRHPLLHRVLVCAGAVFGFLVVLMASCLTMITLRSDDVIRILLDEATRVTGCTISVGSADIRILPVPAVHAENLAVTHGNLVFRADAVTASPSLVSFFARSFVPDDIVLERPTLEGILPGRFEELAKAADTGRGSLSLADAGLLPPRAKIAIRDAAIDIEDSGGSSLEVGGLSMVLDVIAILDSLSGTISADHVVYTAVPAAGADAGADGTPGEGRILDFRSKDILVSGRCQLSYPAASTAVHVTAESELPYLEASINTDVSLSLTQDGLTATGTINGEYTYDNVVIPFDFTGQCEPASLAEYLPYEDLLSRRGGLHLLLQNISMGDDSAGLDAVLDRGSNGPVLTGRLSLTHLSLTRWLTFARWLNAGLQVALDEVSEGILDFRLDTKGLACPRIQATSRGFFFTGEGGVADWDKPVVYLDLTSDHVVLGEAIPESVGVPVQAPRFWHRPLTEMSRDELYADFPKRRLKWFRQNNPAVARLLEELEEEAPEEDAAPRSGDGAKAGDAAGKEARGESAAPATQRDGTPVRGQDGVGAVGAADEAEDGDEGSFGIGYDIRLRARAIDYGAFHLSKGSIIITPTPVDENGERETSLAIRTDLYGGVLTGECIIGGTHADPTFAITADSNLVDAAALRKDFAPLPMARGILRTEVNVKSHGLDVNRFLADLKGTIRATSQRCAVAEPGNEKGYPLSGLTAVLELGRAAWADSSLGLSGKWTLAGKGSWTPSATVRGTVWFGGPGDKVGVRFQNLPATLDVKNIEKLVADIGGRDVALSLKGNVSIDTAAMRFALDKGQVALPGLATRTNATLRRKGEKWTATGSLADARIDLEKLLPAFLGRMPDIPKVLRSGSATSRFTITSERATFGDITARVAGHKVTGTVSTTFAKKPRTTFSLKMDELDLDRMLETGSKASDGKEKKAKAGRPIDLTGLESIAASGTLRVGHLKVAKLAFSDIFLPFSLMGGTMTYANLKAGFYGGTLTSNGRVAFGKGIVYDCLASGKGIEFGDLARDRGIKTRFAGRTEFSANVNGRIERTDLVTQGLNGHIAFATGSLLYQGVDKKNKPKGKPLLLTSTRGSGVMKAGVITTSDLALRSKSLDVNGKGTVDLNSSTLDMAMDVDMRGLPVMPVRVRGNFADPKTSVSIMGTIANIFRVRK